MTSLLSAAGRSFLRAFLAALLVYSFGVLAAPNLNQMYLLGVAALLGAVAAGVRTLQAYATKLSFVVYLGHPYGDWLDAFAQSFIGSLIVTLIGILGAPDLATARALAVAGIVGAFNIGLRALQGALTTGESPAPQHGVVEPKMPYTYAHPAAPAA